MSYDLYFYKKKSSNITKKQVKEYLDNNFHNEQNSHQWNYKNDATGVYFGIDLNESNTDPEDIELWDKFDDFENLNFYFTINFIRPNFFAYEAFPILDKMVDDLDLYILNMQDEIDSDNPQKFEKGYFEKQWINHNKRLVTENFQEFQVDYFSLEKSDYLWNYQYQKDHLQENLEEDIFVAGYFILKNKTDHQLYTACVWPSHIPIIIPPVDYIIVQKEYKKFFRNIKESGLVSFSTIEKEMGQYFDNFEHTIPNLKVLSQNNANRISKQFNSLKIEYSIQEFGDGIFFDGFVNYKSE